MSLVTVVPAVNVPVTGEPASLMRPGPGVAVGVGRGVGVGVALGVGVGAGVPGATVGAGVMVVEPGVPVTRGVGDSSQPEPVHGVSVSGVDTDDGVAVGTTVDGSPVGIGVGMTLVGVGEGLGVGLGVDVGVAYTTGPPSDCPMRMVPQFSTKMPKA